MLILFAMFWVPWTKVIVGKDAVKVREEISFVLPERWSITSESRIHGPRVWVEALPD